MRFKSLITLLVAALMAGVFSVSASTLNEKMDGDPISGAWDVSFYVQGRTTPATFILKLDGNKVTGTVDSAHTGPGTLRDGSWVENKLSFTVDFAKHESIALGAHLEGEKLVGEFTTEGFTAKWEATKKADSQPAAAAVPAPNAPLTAAALSGEWAATFETQGEQVPVTLKLQADGNKFTGTSDSPHLGPGKITNGSWSGDSLSFTLDGPMGAIKVSATYKDGKLAGQYEAGPMKGAWKAGKE
ncbi:MAG: hypothetical protein ABI698_09130 [bacterium]